MQKSSVFAAFFCSKGFKYTRKHRLNDDFWGRQKCDNKLWCHLQQQQKEGEEEEEQQQQQYEEEEEAEEE